jgi:hypothetical protein
MGVTGLPALKRWMLTTRAGRIALVAPRAALATRQAGIFGSIRRIAGWSIRSRELANFTYATTRDSDRLLAGVMAEIARRPLSEMLTYIDELAADSELADYVVAETSRSENRWSMDPVFLPGRRLAFYLAARALKPALVVEAGVDKGLGAILVSRALARNAAEGHAGDYLGIEYDREKPIPLYANYPGRIGTIVRGDSVEILRGLGRPVSLFIHDTTAAADHMRAQLATVDPMMETSGLIASTWTTESLVDHAVATGRRLLSHQEEPAGHWFRGDRVGFLWGFGTPPPCRTSETAPPPSG